MATTSATLGLKERGAEAMVSPAFAPSPGSVGHHRLGADGLEPLPEVAGVGPGHELERRHVLAALDGVVAAEAHVVVEASLSLPVRVKGRRLDEVPAELGAHLAGPMAELAALLEDGQPGPRLAVDVELPAIGPRLDELDGHQRVHERPG